MASKLTKDQKREKSKRDAQKKSRQRQHETNREYKKLDQLSELLHFALMGVGELGAIEAALLKVGDALSLDASVDQSDFKWEGWRDVRNRTSMLIELLQRAPQGQRFGLHGRIYHVDASFEWADTIAFSFYTAMESKWSPLMVGSKMVQELDPKPVESVFFFGIEIGEDSVHIAVMSNADASKQNYFVVTAQGWRLIPDGKWHAVVWPFLGSAHAGNISVHGADFSRDALKSLRLLQGGNVIAPEGEVQDLAPLTPETRDLVCNLLHPMYVESALLVDASSQRMGARLQDEYDSGWADGSQAGQVELLDLTKRLAGTQAENAALKLAVDARTRRHAAEKDQSAVAAVAEALPLHARMRALFDIGGPKR